MRERKGIFDNKYIVLLLIIGAVYFFLRFISPLLTPIIIAGMFLTLCYPTFDDIQKKTRIKKQYLASAILLLICGVLIILVWIGGSFLVQKIPQWIANIDNVQDEIQIFITQCSEGIGNLIGVNVGGLTQILVEQINLFVENFQAQVLPHIIGESWIYIKQIISIIAVLAVTMIATVLLAKDYDAILSWTGAQAESRVVLEIVLKVIRYIATFLKAQVTIMFCIASLCVIVLLLAGVENAALFGILAGLLDALPFIGTGIVLLPLALFQIFLGSYWKALICVILYICCVLLREFMEPKLIGQKVGVYPIAILMAIYAGLQLFGLWGIVKGPVGFVIIKQTFEAYCRYIDGRRQMNYDKKDDIQKEESV